MKKNIYNTSGNVSIFRFTDKKDNFSMADLLYVNSQHKAIEKMYRFLHVFYLWSQTPKENHIKTAIKVVKDAKIDMHILSKMKEHNYINEDYKWKLKGKPSKADAVFLRLELRQKRKKSLKNHNSNL